MSELRERKRTAGQLQAAPSAVSTSPHAAGLGSNKKTPPRTARSSRRLAPTVLNAVFGLAIVGLAVLYTQKQAPRYPSRFGICTFDESVYVDPYTRTECVVVGKNGSIEYTGTRKSTRERFGDLDTLGKLARWNLQMPGTESKTRTGLKIYTLSRGQAVFPGKACSSQSQQRLT